MDNPNIFASSPDLTSTQDGSKLAALEEVIIDRFPPLASMMWISRSAPVPELKAIFMPSGDQAG